MSRATHLRHWRSLAGLTHREVAALIDTPEARISKLENNHVKVTDDVIGRYLRANLCTDTMAAEALRLPTEAVA